MKYLIQLVSLLLFVTFISSCTKEEIDTEKPVIRIDFTDAFPLNCDTLYFGETITVKIRFTDNIELGSYSLSIHNNFDNHNHSTDFSECILDPVKEPVNPFSFVQDYNIPDGSTEYETSTTISIPLDNTEGNYDEGDYHFFISVSDSEGWSSQLGLSVKMLQ